MNRYKNKFLDEWLVNTQFKSWMKKDPNNEHLAYCNYFCKSFSVAGWSINQVLLHITGSKHKSKPSSSKDSTQTTVNVSTSEATSSTSQSKQSSPSSLNQTQSKSLVISQKKMSVQRACGLWRF